MLSPRHCEICLEAVGAAVPWTCGCHGLWHKQQAYRAAAQETTPSLNSTTVPYSSSHLAAQLGDEKTHQNSKRKWFDEKQKRLKEELERRGLTEKEKHRLESAEVNLHSRSHLHDHSGAAQNPLPEGEAPPAARRGEPMLDSEFPGLGPGHDVPTFRSHPETPCAFVKAVDAHQSVGVCRTWTRIQPFVSLPLQTAEVLYKKRQKKEAPKGWESFNQHTLFRGYEKRSDKIEPDMEVRAMVLT